MPELNLDQLIYARAAGMSLAQTAALVGVSKRTVQRRLEDPEVQRRIAQQQARSGEMAAAEWRARQSKALGVLDELMDNAEKETTRLRAAQVVLQNYDTQLALRELNERQDALVKRVLDLQSAHEEDLEWPGD